MHVKCLEWGLVHSVNDDDDGVVVTVVIIGPVLAARYLPLLGRSQDCYWVCPLQGPPSSGLRRPVNSKTTGLSLRFSPRFPQSLCLGPGR